ncbi:MAG: branched-chain amino acid ABC transporter permease [Syntrophomonadaceae bacterium]|nr:branched-chain amino acid ABC transporter permease [Syntrophomonadaceae bacterium]
MEFLQQLVNGLALGSIYALIAIGYTMVYGIVQLINFAHGDIYMIGAFVGFFAVVKYGLPFLPTLLLAMLVCSVLGVIIEKIAYRPLRNSPRITALITAIGVSLFLENVVRWRLGPDPRPFPELFSVKVFSLGGVQVSNVQLLIFGVALVLIVILQFIIYRTRIGKAMRAVSQDQDAARLMGINVDRTISVTFAIGSALAAAAGILVGIAYPRIDPYMGILPGLKAFVAAVLGGIGIIPGAMLGGLVMGVAELMVVGFWSSDYRDAIAFAILIIILLIKPTGILGKNQSEKV